MRIADIDIQKVYGDLYNKLPWWLFEFVLILNNLNNQMNNQGFDLTGQKVQGYSISKPIGQGKFSIVYKA